MSKTCKVKKVENVKEKIKTCGQQGKEFQEKRERAEDGLQVRLILLGAMA